MAEVPQAAAGLKPVTKWYRWRLNDGWVFDHYSEGHSQYSLPRDAEGKVIRGKWQNYWVWRDESCDPPKMTFFK